MLASKPVKAAVLSIFYLVLIINISCASNPPPQTLPQAKVAVSSVNNGNYKNYVPTDVDQLITKLQQAEEANSNKQNNQAEQLAQQILIDVELIQLKTQRIIAEQETKNLQASINSLNKELEWREPIELTPLNE